MDSTGIALLVLFVCGIILLALVIWFGVTVFMAARAARTYFERENLRIERQYSERR